MMPEFGEVATVPTFQVAGLKPVRTALPGVDLGVLKN